MGGNPGVVEVWKELTSKVEEKLSSMRSRHQTSVAWFEEYFESAKAKLEGPGGAPTFVPKVRTKQRNI